MGSAISASGGSTTFTAGTGTGTYKAGGVLNASATQLGTTAGTGEEVLWTYTLPANSINAANKGLRITVHSKTAANGNTKTHRIYVGTQTIYTVAGANNNVAFHFTHEAFRITTTSGIAHGLSIIGSVAPLISAPVALTQDWTADMVIKFTGQNTTGSANDLVFVYGVVEILA